MIDARPSDSIAIALRLDAPIFAAEELLAAIRRGRGRGGAERAGGRRDCRGQPICAHVAPSELLGAEQLKAYLENLRPEDFGKFNRVTLAAPLARAARAPRRGAPAPRRSARSAHVGRRARAGVPRGGASLVDGRVVRPAVPASARARRCASRCTASGTDSAGPLDSMRTTPSGQLSRSVTHAPATRQRAVLRRRRRYDGIAYFTAPLRECAPWRGDDAEIVVYDTTSAPGRGSRVQGRHLVIVRRRVSRHAATVVEVFELSNDTSVTRDRPATRRRRCWTAPLPDGATDPGADQGDVSPDAVRFSDAATVVAVRAVLARASSSSRFTLHRLPARLPAAAFPSTGTTDVLEVLLEDRRAAQVRRSSLAGAR